MNSGGGQRQFLVPDMFRFDQPSGGQGNHRPREYDILTTPFITPLRGPELDRVARAKTIEPQGVYLPIVRQQLREPIRNCFLARSLVLDAARVIAGCEQLLPGTTG